MVLLSALPALWNAKPIPLRSAESKKETNSLRPLRLSGDFKLSNYNMILYLRIRVLSDRDVVFFLGRTHLQRLKLYVFYVDFCTISFY